MDTVGRTELTVDQKQEVVGSRGIFDSSSTSIDYVPHYLSISHGLERDQWMNVPCCMYVKTRNT